MEDDMVDDKAFAEFLFNRARVEAMVETLAIVGRAVRGQGWFLGLYFRVLDLLLNQEEQ